ncbi:hypothetical protein IAQ61_011968 [Plenodomus lingam]|uniref:Uncharacterized protein n=1 Tax=Leptosphaeria maculans (strain JN3 / isolate v23.1.3 / race Av1-4-5-6-7-8) TaxID=985895 RepID=E5ABN6_LEPMJ|nr:hypothetical protein LEMA_P022070.1 [Plenodomus lingam JN3]KAH9860184.1 hypothetical protein IAQ61_011968 [Plenodomus lingam]CBY01077.1 hypothetical protein LEMA_P022070.1 [Plenodomus lingam JN3]
MDCHPRVTSPSANSSLTSTPLEHSRRTSRDSAHDARHFLQPEEKTHHTLNQSIKKMWREIKQHAIEHHRSVNAAWQAQYGAGVSTGPPNVLEGRARVEHK